jgi:hypothetical protein
MIEYVLEDNLLTEDKANDSYARVVNVRSLTDNDLAEAIAERNLGISKPEVLAMLEACAQIQLKWLASGNAVNTQLAHFHYAIPGTYAEGEHPTEAIVRITPSKMLSEAVKKNTLREIEPLVPIRIERVEDMKSGTTNEFITNLGNVKIYGHNLKIEGKKPGVGVRFVSLEDPGAIYPVPAVDIITNNPKELVIMAPHMVVGEPVQLEITTQFSGSSGRLLNEPRSITYTKTFTVKG